MESIYDIKSMESKLKKAQDPILKEITNEFISFFELLVIETIVEGKSLNNK